MGDLGLRSGCIVDHSSLSCNACGEFSKCSEENPGDGDLKIRLLSLGGTATEMTATEIADSGQFPLSYSFGSGWQANLWAEVQLNDLTSKIIDVFARAQLQIGCEANQRWEKTGQAVLVPESYWDPPDGRKGIFYMQLSPQYLYGFAVEFQNYEPEPPYHTAPGPPPGNITGACFAVGLEIQTLDGAHCGWAARAWHVKPPKP